MDLILQVKLSSSDIMTRQPLFSLIKITPENNKDTCDFVLKEAWFVYTQDKTERKFKIPLDPDAHYFPSCTMNEADLSFIPVGGIEHYKIILKLEKKTMDIPNFIVESTLIHPPVDYYNKPMPEEKVIKINPKKQEPIAIESTGYITAKMHSIRIELDSDDKLEMLMNKKF